MPKKAAETAAAAPRPRAIGKKRGRLADGSPNPIDVHIGARIRIRRTLLGMSQEKLGEAIGLTFQQVQKYERGANRVGASRLYDLSQVLDVPVSFFFDGLAEEAQASSPANIAKGLAPAQGQTETEELDPMIKRETLELVRAYFAINDPDTRRSFYALVKAMAADEEAEDGDEDGCNDADEDIDSDEE